MEELEKKLISIGLSEKQAKVYLAILNLGEGVVQKISDKSGVNRATTYVVLESLIGHGLVSTFEHGKKTTFIAEGPHALHNILYSQEKELEEKEARFSKTISELTTIYNLHPNKPSVVFYEGKDGLKKMLKERRSDQPSEVRVFYPSKLVAEAFSGGEAVGLREKRVTKKIKLRLICSGEIDAQSKGAQLYEHKVVPEEENFSSDIEIWDDKVLMASLEGHVSGVIIENKKIADTFKAIFDLIYSDL